MKNFRSITAAVIFTVLIFTGGCSDQLITPAMQSTGMENVQGSSEKKINTDVFHTEISLEPHEIYTFDATNTAYTTFKSISVLNCAEAKKSVEIFGYSNDAVYVLGCSSKGFHAYSITVENLTAHSLKLDIYLTGISSFIHDPLHFDDVQF